MVGYCRLRILDGKAKLERFAVYPQYRGKGIGKGLVRFLIEYCLEMGYTQQYLNAQVRVQKFYENLGFKSRGNRFMEAGIEHTTMDYQG